MFKGSVCVDYVRLSEAEDVEKTARLFAKVFVEREVLASCVNANVPQMLPVARALCRLCAAHGLSFIAKTLDGNVVGCLLCEPFATADEEDAAAASEAVRFAQREMESALAGSPSLAPIFELLESVDLEMTKKIRRADDDRKRNVLHILAGAVSSDFSGQGIASVLAFKAVRFAQRTRGITAVAQEATGSASQYILRRSFGERPIVEVRASYRTWTSASSRRPFQNAPCEYVLGRVDRAEPPGSIEYTFRVATVFLSAHKETRESLSNAQSLQLYALYKQAVFGDARRDGSVSLLQGPVARAKANAWRELKGTAETDAMRRFVAVVRAANPYFMDIIEHSRHRLSGIIDTEHVLLSHDSFVLLDRGLATVGGAARHDMLAKKLGNALACSSKHSTSSSKRAVVVDDDDDDEASLPTDTLSGSDILNAICQLNIARDPSEALETASLLVESGVIEDTTSRDAALFRPRARYAVRVASRSDAIRNEEDEDTAVVIDRSHWIDGRTKRACMLCSVTFTFLVRQHHCRLCGSVVCEGCSKGRRMLTSLHFHREEGRPVRVCTTCGALDESGVERVVRVIVRGGAAKS